MQPAAWLPAQPPAGAQSLPPARFRVAVAEHFGMCFGVRDAIREAERAAAAGPVTILGQLVHNEEVRDRLGRLGAAEGALRAASAPSAHVIITAHGAADTDRARWAEAGYRVTDTTCPLVRKAHGALAKLVAGGFAPVVIGKHGHVEVEGLAGDFPGAVVVEGLADLPKVPEARRIGIVSQTTQPEARVHSLVGAIRALRPGSEVVYRDTICRPTKDRQRALERLCEQAELIVVVGGANSNNTAELVASVRARGRRAVRVAQAGELQREWFQGVSVAGVTAGTSALRETVATVVRELRRWSREPGIG